MKFYRITCNEDFYVIMAETLEEACHKVNLCYFEGEKEDEAYYKVEELTQEEIIDYLDPLLDLIEKLEEDD